MELPSRYYVDGMTMVRRVQPGAPCKSQSGCDRRAYVRTDGSFSILWFDRCRAARGAVG